MTRTVLWQWRRRVRKLVPRGLIKAGAKRKGCNASSACVLRQIVIIGIYGVLLGGSPIINTLPNVSQRSTAWFRTMRVVRNSS